VPITGDGKGGNHTEVPFIKMNINKGGEKETQVQKDSKVDKKRILKYGATKPLGQQ